MIYLKWLLYVLGLLATMVISPIVAKYSVAQFLCWEALALGPITAICVVFYSYIAAPSHKAWSAVFGFALGSFLAYFAVYAWYPECHPRAGEQTYMAVMLTWLAGLLTLCAVLFHVRRKT